MASRSGVTPTCFKPQNVPTQPAIHFGEIKYKYRNRTYKLKKTSGIRYTHFGPCVVLFTWSTLHASHAHASSTQAGAPVEHSSLLLPVEQPIALSYFGGIPPVLQVIAQGETIYKLLKVDQS